MAKANTLDTVTMALVVIAGLDIGILAVAGVDVLNTILGSVATLERLVDVLIGLSALYVGYNKWVK